MRTWSLALVLGAAVVGHLASELASTNPPLSIYFHDVPSCARSGAWDKAFMSSSALSDPERQHLGGMMRQILAIEDHFESKHRVAQPEAASLFYVPAYFPLLFWLDQRADPSEAEHLACLNATLRGISATPYLARHAGYDHVVIYGYEYPHWKRFDHLVLDNYSPFIANALVLTVSFWSQGRRSALQAAGLYPLLRMVLVPYFASWDCGRTQELLESPRGIVVSFVGSVKDLRPYFVFRERLLVVAAASRPAFANDSRVVIEAVPADDSARAAFARDYAESRAALYASSHFCLVMPGDGNTAGRLFDAMVQGCVPVLLFHPDSYPVLPFASRVPWHRLAVAAAVRTEDDAAAVLARLLATGEDERRERRRGVIAHAPLVALALERCPPGTASALTLVSSELSSRERLLSELMDNIRMLPAPETEAHWLRWGPAA